MGDFLGDGVLMQDFGLAVRADEPDLQIPLKLPGRDVLLMSAERTGNISPVVLHLQIPSLSCAQPCGQVVNEQRGAACSRGHRIVLSRASLVGVDTVSGDRLESADPAGNHRNPKPQKAQDRVK
jgi:hypothetical protein